MVWDTQGRFCRDVAKTKSGYLGHFLGTSELSGMRPTCSPAFRTAPNPE